MSLFVKHVAINNCHGNMVDIAMPSPCSASFHTVPVDLGQGIPVAHVRKNSLGPGDPKHISRAE